MQPRVQKIHIPGLTLNARVWGPDDGHPVLAMHGWLDNAATFDLIAPLLPELRIVSIDFPGHGFSDFLPPSGIYTNIDRAIQMLQAVEALGWTEFSLMGHSLGGIVAQIMAAIIPARIKKVALIDIFGGVTQPTDSIISQLQKYYEAKDKMLAHSVYPTLEDAAQMRAMVNVTRQLSLEGARVLAEGGMHKVPGGYSWTFDLRLQLPTPLALTDEQMRAILTHFKSEAVVILGSEGIMQQYSGFDILYSHFPNVRVIELEGRHHLHLDHPKPVADALANFFQEKK